MPERLPSPPFRTTFPDVGALKAMIVERGAWPTVLLRVAARDEYRPDIPGPLSLFANRRGTSVVRVGGVATRVPEGAYTLTNSGDRYTLEIERPAETLNLHVGGGVAEAVYHALVTPDDRLLDAPEASGMPARGPLRFVPRLHARDAAFELHYARLFRVAEGATEALDEALAVLLRHLLVVHRGVLAEVARVPAASPAVRAELYGRLARALDLARTDYARPLALDELATAAALSKYHFLRLFARTFGQTPHQYVAGLRMEAARRLLRASVLGVAEVGMAVGYDDPSVFSRTFRRHVGASPVLFRAAA
ncbi:MAG TPA: AraC family transcriptional regulator [Rhodothermales bacterium]|nr:AraC family transcriptional regulator [Rhodothermales bacterium]